MRTKIGIVYDRVTCELRRIIIPDEDWQLAAHANVGFGEAFHTETFLGDVSVDDARAIVMRVTGRIPTSSLPLNAVVDAKPPVGTRKTQS